MINHHPWFDEECDVWDEEVWEYCDDLYGYYDDLHEEPDHKEWGLLDGNGKTDVGTLISGKRKQGPQYSTVQKKRKVGNNAHVLELSLTETIIPNHNEEVVLSPVVVWKTVEAAPELPLINDGDGEKVSLLKDWRDRFNVASIPANSKPNLTTDVKDARRTNASRTRQKRSSQPKERDKGLTPNLISTRMAHETEEGKEISMVEAAQSPDHEAMAHKPGSRKRGLEHDTRQSDAKADRVQPFADATNARRVARAVHKAHQSTERASAEEDKGNTRRAEKKKSSRQTTTQLRRSSRLAQRRGARLGGEL